MEIIRCYNTSTEWGHQKKEHYSTQNGSNIVNGFQVDRFFLDICSAYKNSHSEKSNAQEQW
jgi:hypothetical protein